MTTTQMIKTATADAINSLWNEGGNRDDAADAGSNLFHALNGALILDAPDLRADTLVTICDALPAGFLADFRLHLCAGFEDEAHDTFGLDADDTFDPFDD